MIEMCGHVIKMLQGEVAECGVSVIYWGYSWVGNHAKQLAGLRNTNLTTAIIL